MMDAEDRAARVAMLDDTRQQSWLARAPLGYVVTRYEDVVAILRERRFHQAASRLIELSGITNPEFLARRRVSILTAEGDEHGRLRRLVAPAFTPKAADRLRPFMREVVNELLDPLAADRAHRAGGRRVRALPHPHHLRAARRAEGGLEALRRVGARHPAHLQLQLRAGPADHHAGPGRARRLRPPADRGPPPARPATTC